MCSEAALATLQQATFTRTRQEIGHEQQSAAVGERKCAVFVNSTSPSGAGCGLSRVREAPARRVRAGDSESESVESTSSPRSHCGAPEWQAPTLNSFEADVLPSTARAWHLRSESASRRGQHSSLHKDRARTVSRVRGHAVLAPMLLRVRREIGQVLELVLCKLGAVYCLNTQPSSRQKADRWAAMRMSCWKSWRYG